MNTSLTTCHWIGSTDVLPYVTMGSGSLAAMAVFEKGYRNDINVGIKLDLFIRCMCIVSYIKVLENY